MDPNNPRAEAERWLGIAAKLLTARDFLGSKTFAIRAREADPNNDVSDQILAVVETVLAGEKRVNSSQQPDWYSVLQLPRLVRDPDLIANHYRRLVLLLNPDRNRLPFADYALQLVMEAWSVLSDANKKWIFDNELALYLRAEQQQVQQQQQQVQQQNVVVVQPVAAPGAVAIGTAGVAATSSSSPQQLNTFPFFQQQPPLHSMWQQPQQHQHQQQQEEHHQQQHQNEQQQYIHREFMPPPPPPPPPAPAPAPAPAPPQHQPQQQLPPQWRMRDPTPVKGGERIKRPVAPQAIRTTAVPAVAPVVAPVAAPGAAPAVAPARVAATATARVVDGNNAGNVGNSININNNDSNNAGVVNVNVNASNNADVGGGGGGGVENNDAVVVEEELVECFWTACPYCFYIYEYQKMYQDCTLRCQNCKRGFHAVQIPNPPPVSGGNGSDNNGVSSGSDKDKDSSSFCCWGFFPLGFSMAAWKKQNRAENLNGKSNWVPFSPMFACPGKNGGGNFQWFDSSAAAAVGPTNFGRMSTVGRGSSPRVYIDDVEEDVLQVSDPSDSDTSDNDWRSPTQGKKKRKKKKKGRSGRGRRGKARTVDVQDQGNQNPVGGGGVSVGGENVEEELVTQQVVVGLSSEAKPNASKNVAATITRKQARRSVKDMGRLDLNVEFNNDGDEHPPTVSAVNREEDGIENIAFFDGLDEFLSTLPILNVGDEKAKAS